MENTNHESAPTTNPTEAYEQGYYALVELSGRFTARLATNYRTEQPRTPEHVGKLAEWVAMMQDIVDYAEA
jgi:hypothetical protein